VFAPRQAVNELERLDVIGQIYELVGKLAGAAWDCIELERTAGQTFVKNWSSSQNSDAAMQLLAPRFQLFRMY
jgi:hypothetical protein